MPRWPQKPPLGAQINWAHPLAQELVAFWALNEGSGSGVRDAAHAHHSSAFTASWQTSKGGSCAAFGGGTTGIVFPYSASLRPNEFTVITRRNIVSIGGSEFDSAYGETSGTYELDWSIFVAGGATYRLRYNGNFWQAGTPPVGDHVHAVTRDNSGAINFYVDGVLNGSTTGGSGAITDSGFDLRIGVELGGWNDSSQMVWTCLFNRVLSPQQIAAQFTDPYGVFVAPSTRRFFFSASRASSLLIRRRKAALAA